MFDGITVAELRARGSVKWSRFPDAIGAFIAEMDFGTAPEVTEAIQSAISLNQFGYLPEGFVQGMSQAYADFSARRYDYPIDPEFVRPMSDVVQSFIATVTHFSTPGSAVIVPTPAYMPFLSLGAHIGREIIQVPMAQDGSSYVYDLDALADAFTEPGQTLVLCNPHNPIGRVLRREELEAISQVVDAKGGIVFSDEIHAPLTYAGHQHVPYASVNDAAAAHTITATATSKAWNTPGLKTAQLIFSNAAHLEKWQGVGHWAESGASTVGVLAATAAYSRGEPWLTDIITYLDGNRQALHGLIGEHLPGVGYTQPEGTFLAWLDARDLGISGRPSDFFLEHAGVALTAGEDCGAAGFLRLNFATSREILTEALEQMGSAVIHN